MSESLRSSAHSEDFFEALSGDQSDLLTFPSEDEDDFAESEEENTSVASISTTSTVSEVGVEVDEVHNVVFLPWNFNAALLGNDEDVDNDGEGEVEADDIASSTMVLPSEDDPVLASKKVVWWNELDTVSVPSPHTGDNESLERDEIGGYSPAAASHGELIESHLLQRYRSERGRTCAVERNDVEVVSQLLDDFERSVSRYDGWMTQHFFSLLVDCAGRGSLGRLEVVRLMLEAGADAAYLPTNWEELMSMGFLTNGLISAIDTGSDCLATMLHSFGYNLNEARFGCVPAISSLQVIIQSTTRNDDEEDEEGTTVSTLWRFALEQGVSYGQDVLETALEAGRIDILEALLHRGLSPDSSTAKSTPVLLQLCKRDRQYPASMDIMQLLLLHGADVHLVDQRGNTGLHLLACGTQSEDDEQEHERLEMIKMLLQRGADVNRHNHRGSTPLMLACVHFQLSVANLLVSQGRAEISAQDKRGAGALHYLMDQEDASAFLNRAAFRQFVDLLKGGDGEMLLAANDNGRHCLIRAMLNCKYSTEDFQFMLDVAMVALPSDRERKAFLNLQDRFGNTALIYAAIASDLYLVQLLSQHVKLIDLSIRNKIDVAFEGCLSLGRCRELETLQRLCSIDCSLELSLPSLLRDVQRLTSDHQPPLDWLPQFLRIAYFSWKGLVEQHAQQSSKLRHWSEVLRQAASSLTCRALEDAPFADPELLGNWLVRRLDDEAVFVERLRPLHLRKLIDLRLEYEHFVARYVPAMQCIQHEVLSFTYK